MKLSTVVFLCVLAGLAGTIGCRPGQTSKIELGKPSDPKPASPGDAITVFMTGSVLSTLQPCGCSSGQLGGLDRRGAVLAGAPASRRLVLDTGSLLADDGPQDMIKLGIMWQAMAMLGYDLVNLTPEDLAAVANLGLAGDGVFSLITPGGATEAIRQSYSRQFDTPAGLVTITVASLPTESVDARSLSSVFGRREGLRLNILLVDDGPDAVVAKLRNTDAVDVVVCPTAADEPRTLKNDGRGPLLVSVGRMGKYVARLTAKPADGKLALTFDKIAVDESLPQDADLVQLYKDYQLMVKDEQLLEKHPRVPLPDGLKYLGNESCRGCHDYEYDMWAKNPHAHAYETLVKVGSQYDPECVQCHVVGFGYESGYISEKSAKGLRDVGCEVCHGPGSDHLKAVTSGRLDMGIAQPQSKCIDCHYPDRSPNYQGREDEYLRKIIHWREPEEAGDVK